MTLLSLRQFGAAFGRRVILKNLDMDIPERGITLLLGPCGSGKSTLLRTLSGHNQQSSLFRTQGDIWYRGEPLGEAGYPVLLEQKSSALRLNAREAIIDNLPERGQLQRHQQDQLIERLLALYQLQALAPSLTEPLARLPLLERKMILLLGLTACAPSLICLDEPTAGLDEASSQQLLTLITAIANDRSLLVVLHNQQQARKLGGQAYLLAGGTIQENAPTAELLSQPRSEAGREFVGTGTCAVPDPNTDPAMLDESYRERYVPVTSKPDSPAELIPFGPSGFQWIAEKQLGATPRPGIMGNLERDLKALAKVGVNYLVCLEEQQPVAPQALQQVGIQPRHFPVVDMQAPEPEATLELIREMDQLIQSGHKLCVHCKGGLGRTGTLIAAWFIHQGDSAEQAILRLRRKNPRMIQSSVQEQFLHQFERWLGQKNRSNPKRLAHP